MSKIVQSISAAKPIHGPVDRTAPVETRPAPAVAPVEATDQADLRLVIEEGADPGRFIYTVIDRRTGKVISQLPREEVLRMREQETYAAGTVFDGKA